MNEKIQPKYQKVVARCSTCGSEFEIGSTKSSITVDTCSNCHPFYTGKQRFASTDGAIDKFNKRYGLKK